MGAKKAKKVQPINKGVKFLFAVFAVMILFSGTISPDKAMSLAEDKANILVSSQGLTAESIEIVFENGIYIITMEVGQGEFKQSAPVYLTKDGKLLIVGTVYEINDSQNVPSRTEFELDGSELSIGDPTAPVIVIEFSDLQCPFCKRFYDSTVKDLKTNYIDTGKVYFVYKHFPLSFHPSAQIAGEAIECANEQGVWYEYHEKIFNSQNGDFGVSELNQWAIGIVPDTSAFNTCLNSGKYADKVSSDMTEGQSVGVSGTPATFVNGILVSGAQPYETFKVLVDSELSE